MSRRIAIDEYLEVHHVAQLLVQKRHYALDDYHRFRLHMHGGSLTVAFQIGIGGLFHGDTVAQVVYLLYEQLPVEGVRMVEVDGTAFLFGEVGGVVVVGVERHHSHIVGRKGCGNLPYHCRFARTGASGDADYRHVVVHSYSVLDS